MTVKIYSVEVIRAETFTDLNKFEKWTKLSSGGWKIHSPAPLTRSPPAPDFYAAPRSCCDTVQR